MHPILYHCIAMAAAGIAIPLFWGDKVSPNFSHRMGFQTLRGKCCWIIGYLVLLLFALHTANPANIYLSSTATLAGILIEMQTLSHRASSRSISKVVLYHSCPAPSSVPQKKFIDGQHEDTPVFLAFYVEEADWDSNPAATPESRQWFEQFQVAPSFYYMPCSNSALQIVDSLGFYRHIISSENRKFVQAVIRSFSSTSTSAKIPSIPSDTLCKPPASESPLSTLTSL